MFVIIGILFVVAGFAVMYIHNIPLIGRLPGDINIHGKGWSFHFPIMTGMIISLILTIILNLFLRR